MKYLSLFLLFNSFNSMANCNKNAIIWENKTNFTNKINEKRLKILLQEKQSLNFPIAIENKMGCLNKTSSLKIAAVKLLKEKNQFNKKIIISPMSAEFENIENPSIKQYIILTKNNQSLLAKFYAMSFICSGETPLLNEVSMTDFYFNKSNEFQSNMIFATGIAVNLLSNKIEATAQNSVYSIFKNLYEQKSNEILSPIKNLVIKNTTNFLTSTSISSDTISFKNSTFNGNENAPNGCSKQFENVMSQYKIENLSLNETIKGLKVTEDDQLIEISE